MVNDSNNAERLFNYYRFLLNPSFNPYDALSLFEEQHKTFLSLTSLNYKQYNEKILYQKYKEDKTERNPSSHENILI